MLMNKAQLRQTSIILSLVVLFMLFAADAASFVQAETYQYVTQWGSSGIANGHFNQPWGIAIDSAGYVYVVDSQYPRVQKFSSNGAFITKWGKYGTNNPDHSSLSIPDPVGPGTFDFPRGIAVDNSGKVYVVDSGAARVEKFSNTGTYITEWKCSSSGICGIAVDSLGNVYVTDADNDIVQKFSANGTYITQWGGYGRGSGQLYSPEGIAVDSFGNIYVADNCNNRVQKFSSNGTYLSQFGTIGSGDGQFGSPRGIAVDSLGNIYVVDRYNWRVEKFSNNGTYLAKWGDVYKLNDPRGIAIDSKQNMYITDWAGSNDKVVRLDGISTVTVTAPTHGVICSNGPTTAHYGDSLIFSVVPDAGYSIASIIVDGGYVSITSSNCQLIRFDNLHADHSIAAIFTAASNTAIAPVPNGLSGIEAPTVFPAATPATSSQPLMGLISTETTFIALLIEVIVVVVIGGLCSWGKRRKQKNNQTT